MGVTAADQDLADELRRQRKTVLLVANKCEGRVAEAQLAEAWSLGLGEPLPVSAEHGDGIPDLLEAILSHLEVVEAPDEPEAAERPLRLAVIGRPNAGKSTLINRLIDEDRLLTGPEPGLTRDSITLRLDYRGRTIELVDTAGLRRKAKVAGKLEKLSTSATLHTLKFAEVVALVVDATTPLERQDLTIAGLVAREGRALVIVLNKWDLVANPNATMEEVRYMLSTQLADVRGVPCVPLSALTGRNVDKLLPAVLAAHARWDKRVPTARAEPLAWRRARAAPAAPGAGPPGQDPLRHADHRPATDLHPVREQVGGRAARKLPALSRLRPARDVRPGRRADPLSRPARREPLRRATEPGRSRRDGCIQAAGVRPRRLRPSRARARHPGARRDRPARAGGSPSGRDRAG